MKGVIGILLVEFLSLWMQACSSGNQVTPASGSKSTHGSTLADTTNLPSTGPVKEKSGFVTSPYAPNVGYVDVQNFKPGTIVRCPYTGKLFKVPPEGQFVGISL